MAVISRAIEAAVNAGAAFLDATRGPNWIDKIDTSRLQLVSRFDCVLGQLEGSSYVNGQPSYDYAIDRLGLKNPHLLGFTLTPQQAEGATGTRRFNMLTEAWLRLIIKRKRARARAARA